MTHLSHKKIDEKTSDLLDNLLLTIFKNLKSLESNHILNSLLSKTEIAMLKKRLGIIFLLKNNFLPSEISQITKTTIQTVNRIELQLLRLSKEEKMCLFNKLDNYSKNKPIIALLKELADIDITQSKFLKKIKQL